MTSRGGSGSHNALNLSFGSDADRPGTPNSTSSLTSGASASAGGYQTWYAEWYRSHDESFDIGDVGVLNRARNPRGIDSHIAEIRDEQEQVQKKTFVNWINSMLAKHKPPLQINSLIEDLKDGTKLLALLEVLSGEKLPIEKGKVLRRPHFLSNANTALEFLKSKRIKLVNINPSDLVDGRPAVVLGLVWTIILYFQIEENTRLLESMMGRKVEHEHKVGLSLNTSMSPVPTESPLSTLERKKKVTVADSAKTGARKALLQWVKTNITDKYGIPVRDFGASWRDGRAFLAIVHAIDPALVDVGMLSPQGPWTNVTRLETAFKLAERHLGVSPLMDPEDVDVNKPDEKSIMTYVAQFLHKYPDLAASRRSMRTVTDDSAIGTFEREYEDLTYWLAEVTQVLYSIKKSPNDEHGQKRFADLRKEIDEKRKEYEHLKTLALGQSGMVAITVESWSRIQKQWDQLNSELHHQQRAFDSRLQGRIGVIGDWIYRGEAMVADVDSLAHSLQTLTDPGVAYKQASQKLQEHRSFFSELGRIEKELAGLKSKPEEWAGASSDQVADLHRRLLALPRVANRREIRLYFIERKNFLLWFLVTTETKLREWTTSYGKESRVHEMLEDYQRFVSNRNVFQEFDKAYKDLQKASQLYTDEFNPDAEEAREMSRISRELSDRWATVSVELRCVHSLLEKVIMFWRHYSSTAENLESWLDSASAMINADEDQKMEFFRDLPEWQESHHSLNEVGRFLAATCEEKVAAEVDQRLNHINDRWDAVFPMVRHYMRSGEVLRMKKEWEAGKAQVGDWIARADALLNMRHPPTQNALQNYQEQLKTIQDEMEQIQDALRKNSRVFQLLVPELPPDQVQEMMTCLKKHKEDLIRINATIPSRLVMLHQLASQREAIDSGLKEASDWINEAKTKLHNTRVSGSLEMLQNALDGHRVFFSRTPYYRSLLESKNAVFSGLQRSSVDLDKSLDLTDVRKDIEGHFEEFNNVVAEAQAMEQALYKAVCCWQKLRDVLREMSDWIETSNRFFHEKTPESRQSLDVQKAFFSRPNEHLESTLVTAGQDLCASLPPAEHEDINAAVENLVSRWAEAKVYAPLHVLKLDFRLDEITFNEYLKEVDRQLCQQIQSFSQNENPEEILAKHKALFGCEDGCPMFECQKSVDSMERHLAQAFTHAKTGSEPVIKGFEVSVANCRQELEKLRARAHDFVGRVSHVPAQWETYRKKFADMSAWMDDVNDCLQHISQELLSIEEFERHRAKLQTICHEVEAKREEMKQLVQILDGLLVYASEAQALDEQTQLEDLISRYRSLVPSIESTLTKSDVWSRAYVFKKQSGEICKFLLKVDPLAQACETAESPSVIAALKEKSSCFAQEVESQREELITCLQRGRDLLKDPQVPSFVKDDLAVLEDAWNSAQKKMLVVSEKLKNTEKLWTEYEAKRKELMDLLAKADKELQVCAPRHDPVKVIAELQAKQTLSNELTDATAAILRRLKELSEALGKSAMDEKPKIVEQITSMETRLETSTTKMKERIALLEEYSKKFGEFTAELRAIKDWMLEAQKILESLLMKTGPPAEREVKSRQLNTDVRSKLLKITDLEKRAKEFMLGPDEAVLEHGGEFVLPLSTEILGLKEVLVQLVETVELQHRVSAEELTQWEGFHSGLEAVRPWLDQVEGKLVQGIPRFTSMVETQDTLDAWKGIYEECQQQQKTLVLLKAKVEKMPEGTLEEFDALQCRWASVKETAESNLKRVEELRKSWSQCLDGIGDHEDWLEKAKNVQRASAESSGDIGLEAEKMRNLCKEAGERQANLLALSQQCDQVASKLSSDGAAALRNKIAVLRTGYVDVIQESRKQLKTLSDILSSRDDLTQRLRDFQKWLDVRGKKVSIIVKVPVEELEGVAAELSSLMRDIKEKRPVYQQLDSEFKKMPDPPVELVVLNAAVADDLKDVEALLESKAAAIHKWQDLVRWAKDAEEKLVLIGQQLNSHLTPEEAGAILGKISAELDATGSQIDVKLAEAKSCEALSETASIEVQMPHESVVQILGKLSKGIKAKRINVQEKAEELDQAKADNLAFSVLWESLKSLVSSTTEELMSLKPSEDHVRGIKQVLEATKQKKRALDSRQADRKKLQDLCERVGEREPERKTVIQVEVDALDAQWLRAESNAVEVIENCCKLLAAWEQADKSVAEVKKVLDNVSQYLEGESIPDSKTAVIADQQVCKQNLDVLKRSRGQLEVCMGKWNSLVQNLDSIPQLKMGNIQNPCAAMQKQWQNLADLLAKRGQIRDSQIVILEDIEQQKEEITQWLSKFEGLLSKANDSESLNIALESFTVELPVYESVTNSLKEKLQGLWDGGKGFKDARHDVLMLEKKLKDAKAAAADSKSKLESQLGEEKIIREKLRALNERIHGMKGNLTKLLEPTADEAELLQRTAGARTVLNDIEPEIECLNVIKQAISSFNKNHPSEGGRIQLSKECEGAEKNLQGCKTLAMKVVTTLSASLMKKPSEDLKDMERQAKAIKEKICWLTPSEVADIQTLESKVLWLNDRLGDVNQLSCRMVALKKYLGKLDNHDISHQSLLAKLRKDFDHIKQILEEVEKEAKEQAATLSKLLIQWKNFQKAEEQLEENMKGVQVDYRTLNTGCVEASLMDDEVFLMSKALRSRIMSLKEDAETVGTKANELMECFPSCDAAQPVATIMSRCCMMESSLDELTQRLGERDAARKIYDDAVYAVRQWLQNYADRLEEFKALDSSLLLAIDQSQGGKPSLACQAKLNSLKDFITEKAAGQELLNNAVALGEALFGELSIPGREAVRTELRGLRTQWETLLDQLNGVEKKFESVLLQWSSFDESFNQTNVWLSDIAQRLESSVEKKPNLLDKKLQHQNLKALCHELASHKKIINNLKDKGQALHASHVVGNISQLEKEYEALCKDADKRAKVCDGWVLHHDNYNQCVERFVDWMNCLKGEVSFLLESTAASTAASGSAETDVVESMMEVIDGVLNKKEEGNLQLMGCKTMLEAVKEETEASGLPLLDAEYNCQVEAWKHLLAQCVEAKERIQAQTSMWHSCEASLNDLASWLKNIDMRVKEQSALKPSAASKEAQLEKLKQLLKELESRSGDIAKGAENVRKIVSPVDLSDSKLNFQASHLNSRYQHLRAHVKDLVGRYENFVKDHQEFDEGYRHFESWLDEKNCVLKEQTKLVGDLKVLEDRKVKLEEMRNGKLAESARLDGLITSGERLYAHTAPEGREAIRHSLKIAREMWEDYGEALSWALSKLETCLAEFAEFSVQQEQLTKWLRDVESAMLSHTQLKATLQEKNAQCQNHKVVISEMTAQEALVNSVCSKAQSLIDQTQDSSLDTYILSIRQLYAGIEKKAKELFNQLEKNVTTHAEHLTSAKTFEDWCSKFGAQLGEVKHSSGEKGDVLSRLSSAKELMEKKRAGDAGMAKLKASFEALKETTNPKGVDILQSDLNRLSQLWRILSEDAEKLETTLEGSMGQWKNYDEEIERHCAWFRKMEAAFREVEPRISLEEKSEKLKDLLEKRAEIIAYEPKIDDFIDQAHALLQQSGVARIKPQISQMSSRYHLLHTLSKEMCNKWEGLVDDHRLYDERFLEAVAVLSDLEDKVHRLEKDEQAAANGDTSTPSRVSAQDVTTARQRGSHQLSFVTTQGERLYPHTAAAGRDKIRTELRHLRDRWDEVEVRLGEMQKKHEADAQQRTCLQESLQQTRAWLETMEKTVAQDVSNAVTPSELRSRLVKIKTVQQEVASHWRLIEN